MPRPFRFGVLNTGNTLEDWNDFARKAEDLGFSTLIVQDHFAPQLAPLPALMIGGRQKRMLSFAAREADIVSISMLDRPVPGEPPPPAFAQKIEWVRAAAGKRFDEIEIHANGSNITVTDNRNAALEGL